MSDGSAQYGAHASSIPGKFGFMAHTMTLLRLVELRRGWQFIDKYRVGYLALGPFRGNEFQRSRSFLVTSAAARGESSMSTSNSNWDWARSAWPPRAAGTSIGLCGSRLWLDAQSDVTGECGYRKLMLLED